MPDPTPLPPDAQAFAEAVFEHLRPLVREEIRRAVEEAGGTRPLLGLDDVAAVLQCSKRTVQRLIARGELASVRVGAKRARVHPDALDDYVRANAQSY